MTALRRPGRLVAHGLAAVLLLGACGRGVSEQRVASRAAKPGTDVTEPPPAEATSSTVPAGPADADPTPPEPTATTTPPTTASPPKATTTTTPQPGDPCAGVTLTEFGISAAGAKPTDLVVAADGGVWFTDNGLAAVGRLAPDGTVRTFPLTQNRQPTGIAVGRNGDIWFTQYAWYNAGRSSDPSAPPPDPGSIGPPAIGRISPDGTMTEFPLPTVDGNRMGDPTSGSVPRGIVAGPDGAMWFTESGADQIGRITADGTVTEYPLPSRSEMHAFPDGIALGSDGAIWFAETLRGAIGRIDVSNGAINENRNTAASAAALLVRGPDGALWFSASFGGGIGRMTTAGNASSFPISPQAEQVNALLAGPDGRLWFADDRSASVLRITTKGNVSKLLTVPNVPAKDWEALGGMAQAPDHSVWLAAPSSSKIYRISCPGLVATDDRPSV